MEGLIPYVIHAIKSRRLRRSYRCFSWSEGSNNAAAAAELADWNLSLQPQQDREEGSSSLLHRRTLSEFTVSSHGTAMTAVTPSSSMDRRPAEAASSSRSMRADPWQIRRAVNGRS